jgi:hypothetical protein
LPETPSTPPPPAKSEDEEDPEKPKIAAPPGLVVPANDPPIAEPIMVALEEDTAIVIDLSQYVTPGPNKDNQLLTFDLVTEPNRGTAQLTPDNTITYKPDPDYYGSDELTYRACDNYQACSTAAITISVLPVPEFHGIGPVKLSPSSPAKLPAVDWITISFQYSTTEPSGVVISVRPYYRGVPIAATMTPSSFYDTGTGSGRSRFSVVIGDVDEIRIEMRAVGDDELLFEDTIPVMYHFGSSDPSTKDK